MARFSLTVNGRSRTVDAPADMPLLWVLRDLLQLTGTKFGCGMGVCGACSVMEGRAAVRSCQIPIAKAANRAYTTIEGISERGDHPCQRAWVMEDVAQCGYCQAGAIVTAAALLERTPHPSDHDIDAAMGATICRCGTYNRMRRAIHRAAEMKGRA